jgi:hypothetical protein
LNIYIYGSKGFKEEIHKTLEHANIKFKIDVDAKIEDINSLDDLKSMIAQSPSDIYLIDEDKIIKKNLINQKIKLFTAKDAIEEEFLLENGVADISVDSLDDIPKYIIKKFEEESLKDENIQDSIIEIVDEAYSESEDTIDLDDELSALLEPESKKAEFSENVGLHNTNVDYDDETTHEDSESLDELNTSEEIKEDESFDFHSLDDELKELDELDLDNNENIPNVEDELDSLLELDDVKEDEIQIKESSIEDITLLSENDEDDVLSQALEIENIDEEFEDILKGLDEIDLEEDDSTSKIEDIDDIDSLISLDVEDDKNEDDMELDLDEDFDDLFKDLELSNEDNDKVSVNNSYDEELNEGVKMSQDEFAQLDSLNESDVLSALADLDSATIPSSPKAKSTNIDTKKENVEIASSNVNDLAQMISQLLNNKTLEITIKIKD